MSFDPNPIPVETSPAEDPNREPELWRCNLCGKTADDPLDLCEPEKAE